MATYRVVCIEQGRTIEQSSFVAEDDAEALALFSLRHEVTDCEIWCGERLVARLPRGELPVLLKRR